MNLFNFIKSHVSIVTVVGEYATLKKAGLYLKAPCPFHNERTPSFTVSPHKEIFYCFGCHEGGDVVSFIARIERCTPLQAAMHLIDRYHLSVPESLADQVHDASESKRYYEICNQLSTWCHEQLLKSKNALEYLTQRGVHQKSIKTYQIGYFPGGLTAIKTLITEMGRHNILADDLIAIQILSRGKQVLFSPFEERIIFPISDHLGRVCGFGGRVFKTGDNRPKYYNSHENSFFTKGQLLFGLHLAKKEIQTHQKLFLVEGYTDAIAIAQHGYPYVVATLGTSCTPEHLQLLSRYAQQVYVCYDGDQAGMHAILRIAQLCWQVNLEVSVVLLPAGEDPASFLHKGQSLETAVMQAQDIFTFFINQVGSDFNKKSLSDKLAAVRKITEMIVRLDDPLKQELLVQQASAILALPYQSLVQEMNQLKASVDRPLPAKTDKPAKIDPVVGIDGGATLEKKIFYGILNHNELLTSQNADFLCTYLPDPYKSVLAVLQREKGNNPSLTFAQFFQVLDQPYQQLVSQVILEYQEAIDAPTFEQLIVQLQRKYWKVIVNEIKLKLEYARLHGSQQEVQSLIEQFLALQKKVLDKK